MKPSKLYHIVSFSIRDSTEPHLYIHRHLIVCHRNRQTSSSNIPIRKRNIAYTVELQP